MDIFRDIENDVLQVARRHLVDNNSHYLKFASRDMLLARINTLVAPSVSYALGYTGHGEYLQKPVGDTLRKEIQAGILTKNVSYPEDDDLEAEEYQEESGDTDDKFREQFGNSNANPNFKKRKDHREQMTQLDKLLMDSTMDEAFNYYSFLVQVG